jgi:transposase-like protein
MTTNARDPEADIARPKCSVCGKRMTLTRKVAVPALGPGCEFRSYACSGCGNTLTEKFIPR